jgi:hypothetical protein
MSTRNELVLLKRVGVNLVNDLTREKRERSS